MSARPPKPFLTAFWRNLALLNYEVDPAVLAPFVPGGTELDLWQAKAFVSVVGFQFLDTRIWGVPIPFHRHFEEVNLRFYVRRHTAAGWRRGVVFLKEIVPRRAIAGIARVLYHEPYVALPMAHRIETVAGEVKSVEYSWLLNGQPNRLALTLRGGWEKLREGSAAEFITEHYWGYNVQPDGNTLEYRVEHPRWRTAAVSATQLHCDIAALYGEQFSDCRKREPSSAFLAEGSAVTVYSGQRLR
jgi:uncharacterized protein YqjF (DUF2071 family)